MQPVSRPAIRACGPPSSPTIARRSWMPWGVSKIRCVTCARRSIGATKPPSTDFSPMPRRCAMLWEVEILPKGHDPEAQRIVAEFALLRPGETPPDVRLASRGFLLEGDFGRDQAECLLNELLLDPLVEIGRVG